MGGPHASNSRQLSHAARAVSSAVPPVQAIIDQVDGLITFKAAPEPLLQWDRNVAALCQVGRGGREDRAPGWTQETRAAEGRGCMSV